MGCIRLLTAVAAVACAATAAAKPELSAETSEPRFSCFALGEQAELRIRVTGFSANCERPLTVEIADYRGQRLHTDSQSFKTDENGTWNGTVKLATDRFGCFRVSVRSGSVSLGKRGSCPKGVLTYAVLHDPKTRPSISWGDSFFGAYGVSCCDWLGLRHRLGSAPKARPDEGRREVEDWQTNTCWKTWPVGYWHDALFRPDARTYDSGFWSPEARAWILEHVKKRDFSRELVFRDPKGFGYLQEVLPKMMRAAREQSLPGQGKRLVEMMWEPDLGLDAQTVVKVAAALKSAIDQEDPEGGVTCFPSVSNIRSLGYHRELIEAGVLEHLNAYSVHPYVTYPPEPNGLLANIRQLKQMIRARLGHDLPLYGTEQGFATPGTVEGELQKLNGQLRVNFILLGEGFDKNLSFYGEDFGNDDGSDKDGDYGLFFNLDLESRRWGARSAAPRAIAAGLSAATWLVDGKRPTACLEGVWGPDSLGYCYADSKDDCVLVLWDYSGTASEAEIPVGKEAVAVADVMGNERTVPCPDGTLRLTLSETPVYVIGPDPALWGRHGTMAARLAQDAKRRADEREARMKVLIHAVEPGFEGECPIVLVDVENRTAARQDLRLESRRIGDPTARQTKVELFAPGERKTVAIPLRGFAANPLEEVELSVRAGISDGFETVRTARINFWRADRIVGNPEDWRPRRRVDVGRSVWEERMTVPDREDLSAEVAFGWTNEGLVGDFLVTDDSHVNDKTGFMSWNGDSVQLGIARCAVERLTGNNLADLEMQAPSEITLAKTSSGVEAYRTMTFDPKRFPASHDGGGRIASGELSLAVTRTGAQTHYRFMLPWKYFNLDRPVAGGNVRVAALFNDADVGEKPLTQVRLFELKKESPRRFGRLVLGEAVKNAEKPETKGGRARLVLSGVIGQTMADASRDPIPWTDCSWVVADKSGRVLFSGGFAVRADAPGVERIRTDFTGTVVSDGEGNLFAVNPSSRSVSALLVGSDELKAGETLFRMQGGLEALHVAPASCTKGFAVRGRFFALDRRDKKVYGWSSSGEALGVVLDAGMCSNRLESVAICPETGDLLLGAGWPECLVRRFAPGGREVFDASWPRHVAAAALQNCNGKTWALLMGATRVNQNFSSRERLSLGSFSDKTRGMAFDGKGYWLATTQGAQRFLPDNPARCVRRLGGVQGVSALAVSEGHLFAFSGWRILHFWLDDGLADSLSSDLNWGISKTWSERVSGVDVRDGKLYINEATTGRVIFLDPRLTAYRDRAKRQYDVSGVTVASRGLTAKLGKDHAAKVTPSGIELYLRTGPGKYILQDRTREIASSIAAEGEWLVAYVPARAAIFRYRLSLD